MYGSARVGTVSTVDTAKKKVRVLFKDQDNMVSDELSVVIPYAGGNFEPPAVEDVVLCLFTATGDGYCLGKIEEGG
ncbi:MAG: hypothetical protein E6Z15_19530 [Paenibacillus macerans]|nr:hypothetical protein [Paenibacillus macerans]